MRINRKLYEVHCLVRGTGILRTYASSPEEARKIFEAGYEDELNTDGVDVAHIKWETMKEEDL